jgi:hypothetical protein
VSAVPAAGGECGQPGRLYPVTDADAAAIAAAAEGWAHKPGLKSLWQTSMVARCLVHAPAGSPAWLFADRVYPCDQAVAAPVGR